MPKGRPTAQTIAIWYAIYPIHATVRPQILEKTIEK